jgi:tetratricopeptide (TPR) repeat protein
MGTMKIPPRPDPNDLRICGFAQHEMEVLRAGDGDRSLGRLRLALRRAQELDAASAAEAERGEAAYEVGRAYDGMGDDANAELWMARALATRAWRESDRWAHHCPSLALRYLWRGDFARAEPLAREAVEHARAGRTLGEDALVGALQTHGEVLIGTGRADEAVATLDEALRLARASAWIQQFRAGYTVSAMLHLGRPRGAGPHGRGAPLAGPGGGGERGVDHACAPGRAARQRRGAQGRGTHRSRGGARAPGGRLVGRHHPHPPRLQRRRPRSRGPARRPRRGLGPLKVC